LVVAKSVEILIGCFRKGDAENPEVYTRALALILSEYPESVVRRVTDPRTGLPGRSQWLPTIAEVRHACEVEMKPIHEEAERMRRDHQRANRLEPPAKPPREVRAAMIDRMREKLPLIFPDEVGKVDPVKSQREFEQLCRDSRVDVSSIPGRSGFKSARALGAIFATGATW
jgi:hypothetical protein